MKYLLFCIGLLVLMGCKQKPATEVTADNVIASDAVISSVNRDILPGELLDKVESLMGDTLVPMEMSCKECTDPYTKYGYAFDTNCYSCNGIDICITDSVVTLIGSCGEDLLSKTFRIEKIETTAKDEIVIAAKDAKFIFSKVDKAEIYKLVIAGDLSLDTGDPMTKNYFTQPQDFYYAPRRELHKFAIHDCGDFGG